LKFKATDEDSFTSLHTKYKVKIKSPTLGTFKTQFHTSSTPKLEEIIECIYLDYSCFVGNNMQEFIKEFYTDDFVKGREVWNAIEKQSEKLKEWLSYFEEDFLDLEF
jgi:hypothetical protein